MDMSHGIAVLSVMTTVITFFLGFMWIYTGSLLEVVSGTAGFLRGTADRIRWEFPRDGVSEYGVSADDLCERAEETDGVRREVARKVRWVFLGCVVCIVVLVVLMVLMFLLSAVGEYEVWRLVFWGGVIFLVCVEVLSIVAMVSIRMYNDYVQLSRLREASLK